MDLKMCPKCNSNHSNKGRFCSRTCANSRTFSPESRLKKSIQNKKYYENISEEERLKLTDHLSTIRSIDGINRNKAASITALINSDLGSLKKATLKKRILIEQDSKCLLCGIKDWQGKEITLQLDHIDGNKHNNSRENLRVLCPNCHSQTSTFAGRNRAYQAKIFTIK